MIFSLHMSYRTIKHISTQDITIVLVSNLLMKTSLLNDRRLKIFVLLSTLVNAKSQQLKILYSFSIILWCHFILKAIPKTYVDFYCILIYVMNYTEKCFPSNKQFLSQSINYGVHHELNNICTTPGIKHLQIDVGLSSIWHFRVGSMFSRRRHKGHGYLGYDIGLCPIQIFVCIYFGVINI